LSEKYLPTYLGISSELGLDFYTKWFFLAGSLIETGIARTDKLQ